LTVTRADVEVVVVVEDVEVAVVVLVEIVVWAFTSGLDIMPPRTASEAPSLNKNGEVFMWGSFT
jgi:hypothetical protein